MAGAYKAVSWEVESSLINQATNLFVQAQPVPPEKLSARTTAL